MKPMFEKLNSLATNVTALCDAMAPLKAEQEERAKEARTKRKHEAMRAMMKEIQSAPPNG